MNEHVPKENICFTSNDMMVLQAGVLSGNGIGMLPASMSEERSDLIEVMAPMPIWKAPVWIVTHVDLHRSAKVQGFLKHLKNA